MINLWGVSCWWCCHYKVCCANDDDDAKCIMPVMMMWSVSCQWWWRCKAHGASDDNQLLNYLNPTPEWNSIFAISTKYLWSTKAKFITDRWMKATDSISCTLKITSQCKPVWSIIVYLRKSRKCFWKQEGNSIYLSFFLTENTKI